MPGYSKEKYGTVRYSTGFGHASLHALLFPQYHWIRFPKWLNKLDMYLITPVLQFLFGSLITWYQRKIYNRAYQNALKKWPHLRAEILVDADWLEYIDGAIRVEGHKKLVLGWNGETVGTWITAGYGDDEDDAS